MVPAATERVPFLDRPTASAIIPGPQGVPDILGADPTIPPSPRPRRTARSDGDALSDRGKRSRRRLVSAMSRSRFLGQLALTVLATSATAAAGALTLDVTSDFNSALQKWERGQKQEALDAMRQILASDPDPAEVFEAYLAADSDVLTGFMTEGDEYTLVAKRFLERAGAGRQAIERDEDRIKELVGSYMRASDPVERLRTISELRAKHGEYAAPRFVNVLSNADDPDKVRNAQLGLKGLGAQAVLPLVAALGSADDFQRQNAAVTLGYIGDPRAGAHLLATSASDASDTVRAAAAAAAEACSASGDAVSALLELGNKYHHRDASVLFDSAKSDVVWSWGEGKLASVNVPAGVYNNELAKDAYYTALALQPDSDKALAGIARESVDIEAKLASLASAGQDVSDLMAAAAEGMLAVESAGSRALDMALSMAVSEGDDSTGARIAAKLGHVSSAPTEGLQAALAGGGMTLQGEAAVALAHIAVNTQQSAPMNVVDALSRAAATRVMKVAIIIDGDVQRATALAAALEAQGVLGQHAGSGVSGLVMLGQVPGVDTILVGDDLSDLTADAVIQQIRENPAYENTPTFLLTANDELAGAFGDRIQGSFAGADGVAALQEVFDANFDDSRSRADALSGKAASALSALARSGRTDVSSAMGGLMSAIDGRRDGVAIPALGALAQVGGVASVDGILNVLSSDDASDEVRVAAAGALGSIGSRVALAEEAANAVREVLSGDASISVRSAAARALGRMNLGAPARAGVLEAVRVRVGTSSE